MDIYTGVIILGLVVCKTITLFACCQVIGKLSGSTGDSGKAKYTTFVIQS